MEAIIFCGIQASGKTSFYAANYLKSHVRISLDLFNTRRKETILLNTCLANQQRFVVDNTNATIKERQVYINAAKAHKFKVIVFYFHSTLGAAIMRNKKRAGKEIVPPAGIGGTFKRFEMPTIEEGFDELYKVTIVDNNFVIEKMNNEVDTIKSQGADNS